ncbi:hypothetical protein GLW05_06535 [Pontibacillus yanchengensis]|uniref:Uncharacterized protein n=1 Tax=Pontibacillus yanchengensis TaxID=462910 RepID=A0A6I4ZWT9_9BACI|nr:hypothetical protein [Pontibacillus yanchengensis]MYL33256.1 hypothetical protein [Pontibacillus yanchengensis]
MSLKNWKNHFLTFEFEIYEKYSEQIEHFLIKQLSDINSRIDNHIRDLGINDEQEIESLYESMFEEDQENFRNEFPYILRKSLFLTIYAKLEEKLYMYCNYFNNKEGKQIYRNGRDRGLKSYQKYLENYIEFPSHTKEWKSIEHFIVIRNYLIHGGTNLIVKEDNQKILNALKQFPKLIKLSTMTKYGNSPDSMFTFHLNENFCKKFIEYATNLIIMVDEEVEIYDKNLSLK